jgi:hypothetical protein
MTETKKKAEMLVKQFLPFMHPFHDEVANEKTGEILRKIESTTELTTTEMEVYNEKCRNNAFDMFGVQIPLPNEQLKMENLLTEEC